MSARRVPLPWPVVVAASLIMSAMTSSARAATREVDAALASMASEIAEVRKSCDQPVKIDATKVALSDKVDAVHVVLASGPCLGQFGQYDYLLVEDADGRWSTALDGGPGMLDFSPDRGSRFARIGMLALMGCKLSFTWDGSTYVRHASKECAGGSKPEGWKILERVMRASQTTAPRTASASPTAVLADIVGKVDHGGMVAWTSPGFGAAMRPYLTPELIEAVEHGRAVAKQKSIDLYDGEFFTGRQSVRRAKLLRASVTGMDGGGTVVSAVIGTSEGGAPPRTGTPYTYVFKLVGGSWKVDDFRTGSGPRTVKDLFMDPENGDPDVR